MRFNYWIIIIIIIILIAISIIVKSYEQIDWLICRPAAAAGGGKYELYSS